MAQTLQELRAAVAKSEKVLAEAERALARVDTDFVSAKNQMTELTARITSGAPVAAELGAVVARLQRLEEGRAPAEARVVEARDAHDDAQAELEGFMQTIAEAPDFGRMISMFEEMSNSESSEAVQAWCQVARDTLRAIAVIKDTPAFKLPYGERTVGGMLAEAMTTHLKLLPALRGGVSLPAGGTLQVPDQAFLEYRGISQGGKDRFHWEIPASYSGRRGRAYVELYIER